MPWHSAHSTRLWPCNPGQPRFLTPEFVDNALYSLFGILIYGDLAMVYIRTGVGILFQHGAPGAMAAEVETAPREIDSE